MRLLRASLPAMVLLALLLPVLTGGGHAMQLATQVLVLCCFGLSYQLLFGRTGMLSFGHAVSFGLAAFGTAHAVRALAGVPVYELLPLAGAAVGALCGLLLGYPVTRRSGIAFAMVTLGLGELVAACFLMFPGFFGGEAGVTLQRTRVPSMLGLDYGRGAAQLLLTAAWTAAVLLGVHWLSHTPFGLATLAVRENAQRIEYLGFRTATVRWVSMAVASTLAGVAGALSALAYEIVTVDAVSLHLSANVLLMTVIGGLGSLWGPLVGALFLTGMQSVVSDWTRAWLFYYGFVFVVLVWLAPEGITGLWQAARRQRPAPRRVALALLFALLLVVFIETAYQVALGEPTRLPGWKHLGPGALQGLLWASGLAVAALLARGLRRTDDAGAGA
jgi:branched-chain amino acid transport system permease protein